MNAQLPSLFAWAVDPLWIIPVAGAAVCVVAFLAGRRLFASRPGPAPEVLPEGDTFLQGVTRERRAAPRRRGNAVEVLLTDGTADPVHGWVANRSMGGLCVLLEQPLAEGLAMKIRPGQAPEQAPWVPVIVKGCRPDGGQWEAHIQFVQMPTWSVLVMFG
jgi:hypothetical protein